MINWDKKVAERQRKIIEEAQRQQYLDRKRPETVKFLKPNSQAISKARKRPSSTPLTEVNATLDATPQSQSVMADANPGPLRPINLVGQMLDQMEGYGELPVLAQNAIRLFEEQHRSILSDFKLIQNFPGDEDSDYNTLTVYTALLNRTTRVEIEQRDRRSNLAKKVVKTLTKLRDATYVQKLIMTSYNGEYVFLVRQQADRNLRQFLQPPATIDTVGRVDRFIDVCQKLLSLFYNLHCEGFCKFSSFFSENYPTVLF